MHGTTSLKKYVFWVACDEAYMQVLSSVWSDTEYILTRVERPVGLTLKLIKWRNHETTLLHGEGGGM